jgi:phosphatidate cytidylyltransferase
MLLKRLLTALIIAPISVVGILMLDQNGFALALALILIISSWEYCNLIQIKSLAGKALYASLVLVLTYFLTNESSSLATVLYAAAIWWIIALFYVVSYPKYSSLLSKILAIKLINGFFLFVPMAISLKAIHLQDRTLVLFLLVLIWAADVGAYFAGRAYGKNKLCPAVSPGKTLEGVYGGIALSQLVAISYVYISIQTPSVNDFLMFCFLSLSVALVSVLGDLFESVLKRIAKVKDSGKLLPGHGGLLDRVDSLTSSAPIFFLLFIFLI